MLNHHLKAIHSARAGKKLSDRLEERFSAKDHKKIIRRVTHLTVFEEPNDDEATRNKTLRGQESSMMDSSPKIRNFEDQNDPHKSIADLSFDRDDVSQKVVHLSSYHQGEHATSPLQEDKLNAFQLNGTNESSITFAHPLALLTAVESDNSDS